MQDHLTEYEDAHTLKSRIEWGQPGLTIVDVRDRLTFNHGHIMGAIPIPLEDLSIRAKGSLHQGREIFVYGESDTQAAQAASLLRGQGYSQVSQIKGGMVAWQAIGGAVEGI